MKIMKTIAVILISLIFWSCFVCLKNILEALSLMQSLKALNLKELLNQNMNLKI